MSESVVTFTDLGLSSALLDAVSALGYETPSPIQAACIPLLLQGRDLLGQAQTGTGKTAAFALPLLDRIDCSINEPQVLVLTPTRELAVQVAEAFQAYARKLNNFHVLPIYGGQSYALQFKQLKRGPQVVVGTPGRLLDHIERKTLDLSKLRALVLDEADEMLRMGFIEDVETIMAETPAERMTALFSATMPAPIKRITRSYMRDPEEVKIAAKTSTVENIEQVYWPIVERDKLEALVRLLEMEEYEGVIVFARTKIATEEIAERLEARGYSAAALNGDMNQIQRERTVARLKSGALDIVVATDVAARGLDVERLSLVVNYDIPTDTEAYVHRIGRTGRAGRSGKAILFVTPRERRLLKAIEHATKQRIQELALPTGAQVTEKRITKFKEKLIDAFEKESLHFFTEVYDRLLAELNAEPADLSAALLYLAQRDKPLQAKEKELDPGARGGKEFGGKEFGRKEFGGKRERYEPRAAGPADGRDGVSRRRYRIEVGRNDGVQVKNIVGAIANEAGIDSRQIGEIRLYDDFSTVELPDGMPKEAFEHLKRVYVCRKPMRISLDGGADAGDGGEGPARKRGKLDLGSVKDKGARSDKPRFKPDADKAKRKKPRD